MSPLSDRVHALRSDPERGQISILILGMCVVALTMVLGGIGVTAVQIARVHLMDAADAAALDASDALDEQAAYDRGIEHAVVLTDGSVRSAAATYLGAQAPPDGVTSWSLAGGTGSPDGETAVVRLQGQGRIPVVGAVLDAFGGSVTITVESRARAHIE